ncbi:MAG: O-antigen ligase family protein [Planctomycetota bacterium]
MEPTDPPSRGATASRVTGAILALLVAGVVLFWAWSIVDPWIATGRFASADSWTSGWPLAVVLATLGGAIVGAIRREPWPVLAACVVVGALLGCVAAELPHFASNAQLGDGPFLLPYYGALIVGAALYVGAGPRSHPPPQRVLVGALVVGAANTRLFSRELLTPVALLVCTAALALAVARNPRRPFDAFGADRGARTVWFALWGLVAWVFVAALLGDSVTTGFANWHTLVACALLAQAFAVGLDRDGVRRTLFASAILVAVGVGMAASSLLDTAAVEGWARTLATRFRLIDAHPNQIGPFFGGGAVLCATLAALRGGRFALVRRVALLVVAVASLYVVHLTGSRATYLGVAVGLAIAASALWLPVPRRPRVPYLVGAGLLALAVALWFTPLADPVRAKLDQLAFQPNSAIGQRYHYWRMAGSCALDHPWFGAGPGQPYVHAQYAQPSYYDGTRQNFHAHNVLFHVAEGSGIVSLLLFLGVVLGTVELLRRALVRLPRGERALAAAPLAATFGMLASNMLDLGMVQPLYLPLHLFVALGTGAALARSADGASGAKAGDSDAVRGLRPLGAAFVGACVVALGALPLVADVLIVGGRLLAFTTTEPTPARSNARASARSTCSCSAARSSPRTGTPTSSNAVCRRSSAAATARCSTSCAPRPSARPATRRRGSSTRSSLFRARVQGAREALDRVLRLDPRGPLAGEAKMLTSWLDLRAGDLEGRARVVATRSSVSRRSGT